MLPNTSKIILNWQKKIENKEYKHEDLIQVVTEYNDWKK